MLTQWQVKLNISFFNQENLEMDARSRYNASYPRPQYTEIKDGILPGRQNMTCKYRHRFLLQPIKGSRILTQWWGELNISVFIRKNLKWTLVAVFNAHSPQPQYTEIKDGIFPGRGKMTCNYRQRFLIYPIKTDREGSRC